ncbi:MAG: hypothetical protein MUC59_16360 [Saprospiraceae bacterium]|nr:hypothetical protein [Saprospiraceae bacterium]
MKLPPFGSRLLVLSAFLLAQLSLSAQLLNEADLLLQPTELLNFNPTRGGSEAYIKQVGSDNELELLQDQAGLEGNLARVLQAGEWNLAIISQTESGNKLAMGSTTGNVWVSEDQGDSWGLVSSTLPQVYAVRWV